MQAADAEHADVGADLAQRLHRLRSDGDLRILQQPPADQHDLDARVRGQRLGDRRRVGEHRAAALGRQPPRQLERRRPAVEQQHLGALQQRQRRLGEMRLRLARHVQSLPEAHRGGRGRQRPAVHALHEPAGGQLTQVPPDGVVGDAELDDELAGHHLPVTLQAGEDLASAFGGQHSCGL